MTENETESKPKFRKLTELKASTAQEYQDALIKRVDHFAQTGNSTFNNAIENAIVTGANLFVSIKEKVEGILGKEIKEKVQDAFGKFLLLF